MEQPQQVEGQQPQQDTPHAKRPHRHQQQLMQQQVTTASAAAAADVRRDSVAHEATSREPEDDEAAHPEFRSAGQSSSRHKVCPASQINLCSSDEEEDPQAEKQRLQKRRTQVAAAERPASKKHRAASKTEDMRAAQADTTTVTPVAGEEKCVKMDAKMKKCNRKGVALPRELAVDCFPDSPKTVVVKVTVDGKPKELPEGTCGRVRRFDDNYNRTHYFVSLDKNLAATYEDYTITLLSVNSTRDQMTLHLQSDAVRQEAVTARAKAAEAAVAAGATCWVEHKATGVTLKPHGKIALATDFASKAFGGRQAASNFPVVLTVYSNGKLLGHTAQVIKTNQHRKEWWVIINSDIKSKVVGQKIVKYRTAVPDQIEVYFRSCDGNGVRKHSRSVKNSNNPASDAAAAVANNPQTPGRKPQKTAADRLTGAAAPALAAGQAGGLQVAVPISSKAVVGPSASRQAVGDAQAAKSAATAPRGCRATHNRRPTHSTATPASADQPLAAGGPKGVVAAAAAAECLAAVGDTDAMAHAPATTKQMVPLAAPVLQQQQQQQQQHPEASPTQQSAQGKEAPAAAVQTMAAADSQVTGWYKHKGSGILVKRCGRLYPPVKLLQEAFGNDVASRGCLHVELAVYLGSKVLGRTIARLAFGPEHRQVRIPMELRPEVIGHSVEKFRAAAPDKLEVYICSSTAPGKAATDANPTPPASLMFGCANAQAPKAALAPAAATLATAAATSSQHHQEETCSRIRSGLLPTSASHGGCTAGDIEGNATQDAATRAQPPPAPDVQVTVPATAATAVAAPLGQSQRAEGAAAAAAAAATETVGHRDSADAGLAEETDEQKLGGQQQQQQHAATPAIVSIIDLTGPDPVVKQEAKAADEQQQPSLPSGFSLRPFVNVAQACEQLVLLLEHLSAPDELVLQLETAAAALVHAEEADDSCKGICQLRMQYSFIRTWMNRGRSDKSLSAVQALLVQTGTSPA